MNLHNIDLLKHLGEEREDPINEWHQQRLGRLTSSRFGDMMKQGRGKDEPYGQACIGYVYEKVAELITGAPHLITSQSMEWGLDQEAEAINLYEKRSGNTVESCMFIPYGEHAGGTPDGLVGDDGIIEVKCPFNPKNHVQTLIENVVPEQYKYQVQGNLMATGRKWCDFISYDPRVQEKQLKIVIIRVERDEEIIKQIQNRIADVAKLIQELTNKLK